MYNYDIGGSERKLEVNEGIADIAQNKTLLIEQLTDEPAPSPEIVSGLKNITEVFDHFKPQKEMEFETGDGSSVNETLHFNGLADFGKQGIINQSAFLKQLNLQYDDLQKFARQLKTNKILKTVLENKEAKAAYISAIQAMITELEQTA